MLYSILRLRVGVPVRGVGVAVPPRTVSIGVWIAMRWGLEVVHDIGVLDGRRTIVALNKCVPLHVTGLADSIDSS